MDLRKLKHACILAEEGNYARASRRLNLTQPALTRSIQSLETALALRLFDRGGGGVRPTVDGARILDHARTMLRLESSLRSEAALLARGEAGRVAFGVGPMLSPLIGPVLGDVLADRPHLSVHVEIQPVQLLAGLLLDDRIDFFIADITHAATLDELDTSLLRAIPAGYFVRAGHPLADRSDVALDDLDAFPLASPALGDHGGILGPKPVSQIACEDSAALKAIALATDAVLLGMNLTMEPELNQGRIVPLPVDLLPGGRAHVGIAQRTARTRSVAAQRIIAGFDAALAANAGTRA
jgi:DNA-binding transcriptional LysR family regulator